MQISQQGSCYGIRGCTFFSVAVATNSRLGKIRKMHFVRMKKKNDLSKSRLKINKSLELKKICKSFGYDTIVSTTFLNGLFAICINAKINYGYFMRAFSILMLLGQQQID